MSIFIYRQLTIALLGLTFSHLALAQAKHNHFYGGFEIGDVKLTDRSSEFSSNLVSVVGGSASSSHDSSTSVYRLFGGYQLTENIGLELGYSQSSYVHYQFSGTQKNNFAYKGTSESKINGFDYGVTIRPNQATGLNGLFVKIASTSYQSNANISVTSGSANFSSSGSGQYKQGMLYGVGYDLNIANQFAFRFAVNRTTRISGESGNDAIVYTLGYLQSF